MTTIRGIISQVLEAGIKIFTAAGRSGETFTKREYMQHYGFTSRPLSGAEGIIINEGNHIVMIASDDRRYRIGLEEGEVALYDDLGQKVHLTRQGITVESPMAIAAEAPVITATASKSITATAPAIALNGEVTVTGNVSVTGGISAEGSIIDGGGNTNHHSHP
jgi:phage baseplate assembly protein V